MRAALLVCVTSGLLGCAYNTRGSTATITIATTPAGATCQATRDGKPLGSVLSTPGDLVFDRREGAITLSCTKEGFLPAAAIEEPLGGDALVPAPGLLVISELVDSATGANYRYHRDIEIRLFRPGEVQAPPALPASLDGLRLR